MLYSKLSVWHTGPQAYQEVLQLHLALNLLCHGPIRQGVQVTEHWPTVHGVLLLGAV